MPRPLRDIAHEIVSDWSNMSPHAKPYVSAMYQLDSIDEMYINDTAKSVVLYFLSNAATWRGPVARRIKQELKQLAGVK